MDGKLYSLPITFEGLGFTNIDAVSYILFNLHLSRNPKYLMLGFVLVSYSTVLFLPGPHIHNSIFSRSINLNDSINKLTPSNILVGYDGMQIEIYVD